MQLAVRMDGITVDVAGIGPIGFPVSVAQARKLRRSRMTRCRTTHRGTAASRTWPQDCVTRLRAVLARPPRAVGDWSIMMPPASCTCELCAMLGTFLEDPARRTLESRLAANSRLYVRFRTEEAELPVTYQTMRTGSPERVTSIAAGAASLVHDTGSARLRRELVALGDQARSWPHTAARRELGEIIASIA